MKPQLCTILKDVIGNGGGGDSWGVDIWWRVIVKNDHKRMEK